MTSERQEGPDFEQADSHAEEMVAEAGPHLANLARAYLALRATPRAVPDETREAVAFTASAGTCRRCKSRVRMGGPAPDSCTNCAAPAESHPPRAGEVTVTEDMVETMDSLAGSLCEALATAFPQGRHSAEHPCAYCKARVRNAFPQFVPAEEVVALLEAFGAHEYGCSAHAREIPEDDRTCVCGYGDTLARFRALGRPS